MTVYADILILINTYVDFFILLASSALLRSRARLWRMLLAAFCGGVGSLIILIPQNSELLSSLIQLLLAAIIVVVAFGFSRPIVFLKRLTVFFCTSMLFSGAVYCIWLAFKPERLIINNSVIYFDVSAVGLIIASAAIYGMIMLVRFINGGFGKKERRFVDLSVTHNGVNAKCNCLLDTGNMLRDCFSDMPVAVVDSNISNKLGIDFSNPDESEIKRNKIRFIPFNTIGEEGLMPVFKPDGLLIDGKAADGVLIGISSRRFDSEYDAVANYDIV